MIHIIILSPHNYKYSPRQLAICTIGPSFPNDSPDDTDKIRPTDLMINVHFPRYPLMMKPLKIVLISGIPEPQAYGANILTSDADRAAKVNAHIM